MRQHASRFAVAACLLAAAFPTHGQSPKGAAGPPPPFGGPSWSLADQLAKGGATSSMVLDTGPAVRLVSVEGLQAAQALSAGRAKQGVVKVTRSFTADKEFIAWRQAVIDGKPQYKTATITLYDAGGKVLGRYTLLHAWPAKYIGPALNARNSGNATEAIEIRFDAMTFAR